MTGGQANYGKDNQNGAQMAIDEVNAQKLKIGGKDVKFELFAEDGPARGISRVREQERAQAATRDLAP